MRNRYLHCLLAGFALFTLTIPALAQRPGTVDTRFNPTDRGGQRTGIFGRDAALHGQRATSALYEANYPTLIPIAQRADGRIWLAAPGDFTSVPGLPNLKPALLTDSLGLPLDFLVDDTLPPFYDYSLTDASKAVYDPSTGGLYLSISRGGGIGDTLVRLLATGRYDTAFAADTALIYKTVTLLGAYPDGRVLLRDYNNGQPTLLRLLANGSIDTAFAIKGLPTAATVTGAKIGLDGRVYVSGISPGTPGSPNGFYYRLNDQDSAATSYDGIVGSGTSAPDEIPLLLADGSVLSLSVGLGSGNVTGRRFIPIGTLDPNFVLLPTQDSLGFDLLVTGVSTPQGVFFTRKNQLWRLTGGGAGVRVGTIDSAGAAGDLSQNRSLLPLRSGGFAITATAGRFADLRILTDNAALADAALQPGGAAEPISQLELDTATGRIAIGWAVKWQGNLSQGLHVLQPGDAPSPQNGFAAIATSQDYGSFAYLTDRRLVFSTSSDLLMPRVKALLPGGVPDTVFNRAAAAALSLSSNVYVAAGPGGKTWVAGLDTSATSATGYAPVLARLSAGGTLDSIFTQALGNTALGQTAYAIYDMLPLPDGRLLFAYTHGADQASSNILLGLDGRPARVMTYTDKVITHGGIRPDGKIVAALAPKGDYSRSGRPVVLDSALHIDTALSNPLAGYTYVGLQHNGKLIVQDTAAGGVILRLLPSGRLDSTWQPLTADGPLHVKPLPGDSMLLAYGEFTQIGGIGKRGLARLYAKDTVTALRGALATKAGAMLAWPNPSADGMVSIAIPSLSAATTLYVSDALGRRVSAATIAPGQTLRLRLPAGAYLLTAGNRRARVVVISD